MLIVQWETNTRILLLVLRFFLRADAAGDDDLCVLMAALTAVGVVRSTGQSHDCR